jgi:hypothetical protein
MVSIRCKNRKCPAAKRMLGDAKSKVYGHCDFSFNLVNGTEPFITDDGMVHQSAYFQIKAKSEKERAQRLKCLQKLYGEEIAKIFQDIPGTNPLITWKITPNIIFELSACISRLYTYNEQILEMFGPFVKDISIFRDPDTNTGEIWTRFIRHRLSLMEDKSMSDEEINETALEWTFEDIEGVGSEETMKNLRNIADGIKKKKDEKSF